MLKQVLMILAGLIFLPIGGTTGPVSRAAQIGDNARPDIDVDPQRLTLRYSNKTKFRYEVTLKSTSGCDTSAFNKNPISIASQKSASDRGNFEMCSAGSVVFNWDVKIYSSFLLIETLIYTETWTYEITGIGSKGKMKGAFSSEKHTVAGKKGGSLATRALCGDRQTFCKNDDITYTGVTTYASGASLKVVGTWTPIPPAGLYRCGTNRDQRC